MTELELAMRAKQYISKLANGVDPTTGNMCDDDSILNNVKTVRCLHYVEGILDKVIENNGEVGTTKRKTKVSFFITEEEIQSIKTLNGVVHMTKFVDNINEIVENDGMKKLKSQTITSWLEEKGFLVTETRDDGTKTKVTTEDGVALGIARIEKSGMRGIYHLNVYDENAQQFILDHLIDILNKSK